MSHVRDYYMLAASGAAVVPLLSHMEMDALVVLDNLFDTLVIVAVPILAM